MVEPSSVPVDRCPRCSSLVSHATGGVCLRCLGEQALRTDGSQTADAIDPSSPPSVEEAAPEAYRVRDPARPPRRLAAYELIEDIGRGGMGLVYAAHHQGLGRLVALKLIAGGAFASMEQETRFIREAQSAARLRHPNIVRVFDVGRSGAWLYYAMDLLEGGDLRERAAGEPLDPHAAARLLAEIADAVEHAHREGIIHRDLKPSNILLDATGRGYVADFGLARWELEPAELTHTGQILGTPAFMAPEQAGGKATAAADVYGIGAVFFYALTGRAPFEGGDVADLLARVVRDPAPPPSAFAKTAPPALDAVCLRCLEKNPAARYPSAAALAGDLRRWLRDGEVETPYAPAAEARQLVAAARRRLWIEGYNWDVIPACTEQLTRAAQLAPDCAAVHAELARIHCSMAYGGMDPTPSRRELARQALQRAEELEAADPHARLARAVYLHWIDNDARAATAVIREVLQDRPDDGPALFVAGPLALRSGQWNAAAEYYVRATRAEPPSSQARYFAARTFFFLRDYAAASTWMDEAVRLDPKPLHRRLHLIWYRWHADPEPGRALAAMRALPEADRFRREAAWCECQMLLALRKFDDALAHYERSAPEAGQGAHISSVYSLDEDAYVLRLQRWAGSERQHATEARLRQALDPARTKVGRSASEAMTTALALAVMGDAENALRCVGEALAARPWPVHAADGARLAGANEFYFPAGQLSILAILGETERFFAELARWINIPAAVDVRCLAFDPTFDTLRADPRWGAILPSAQMPITVNDPTTAMS